MESKIVKLTEAESKREAAEVKEGDHHRDKVAVMQDEYIVEIYHQHMAQRLQLPI